MKLRRAVESDLAALMGWFPDAHSTDIWSTPNFRFPFTKETFRKDAHWDELDSYCLVADDGDLLAFGQFYEHFNRVHLARLIVNPNRRGQGCGTELVRRLMEAGHRKLGHDEYSLYVYGWNTPAVACYRSVGFIEHAPPKDDPKSLDDCMFMVRK